LEIDLSPNGFFDLADEFVASIFAGCSYVWQAIPQIGAHVTRLVGDKQTILGTVLPGVYLSDRPIFIGEGAVI
jgi:hypothetical protein